MSGTARPDAFLVGVAKAGTTSLARYLGQHPDVFVPTKKEPNHHLLRREPLPARGPADEATIRFLLHRFSVAAPEAFDALYAPGASARVRIDASVRYLYHEAALDAIREEQPGARIMVLLRDPVERIVSHWRMNRHQYHLEPLGLREALAAEEERVALGWGYDWHYRRVSTYAPQLERLLDRFDRDQVLVVLYGDFVRTPADVIARCFRFLGVADDVVVDRSERGMVPSEPRWPRLDRVLRHPTPVRGALRRVPVGGDRTLVDALLARNAGPVAPLPAGATDDLAESFADDLERVAALLDLPLDELAARLRSAPLATGLVAS